MSETINFNFNKRMKALKTILKNDDILARYKLICLWSVDQFVNSLPEPDDDLNNIINKTLLNTNETSGAQTPEEIHNILMEIRKVLTNELNKLQQVQQHTKNLNIFIKLIENVENKNDVAQAPNVVAERIDILKTYISHIDNLSISDVKRIIDS